MVQLRQLSIYQVFLATNPTPKHVFQRTRGLVRYFNTIYYWREMHTNELGSKERDCPKEQHIKELIGAYQNLHLLAPKGQIRAKE